VAIISLDFFRQYEIRAAAIERRQAGYEGERKMRFL